MPERVFGQIFFNLLNLKRNFNGGYREGNRTEWHILSKFFKIFVNLLKLQEKNK